MPGTYEAFLNLPDPEATLRRRPEYSIRLANEGVWEPSTGYNNLQATIAIGGAQIPTDILLQPAIVNGLTVTLQWTGSSPAGALDYIVEAGTAPGLSNLYNGSIGSAMTINAVVAPGTYYVRVRARSAQGVGPASNEVSFTVGAPAGCNAPPASPAGLAGGVANGIAAVNWSPAAGATSYIVQAGSTPGASDVFNGSVGSTVSVSSPVGAGFRAYVRVYAVNTCGQSGPSNELVLQ